MNSGTVSRAPWLMEGWIPRGGLTVLDGAPGAGKGVVSLDLAARLTRGQGMPPLDRAGAADPAGVLLLNAEDDPASVLRPWLEAAGADLERVQLYGDVRQDGASRPPQLPDLALLADQIGEQSCALVLIDPFMTFVPEDLDASHELTERRILIALDQFARELNIGILLVRDPKRLRQDGSAYRGSRSIGRTDAARSALVVGKHPEREGVRVLAVTRCATGPRPRSLLYVLEGNPAGACQVRWLGETDLRAEDLD